MKTYLLLISYIFISSLFSQVQFDQLTTSNFDDMSRSNLQFADYDNDGDMDVLILGRISSVAKGSSEAYIYRNDGNGIFNRVHLPLKSTVYGNIYWEDVDHDNDLDFLLSGDVSKEHNKLYINQGNDVFTEQYIDVENGNMGYLKDLNQDGLMDIVVIDWFIKIYLNTGDFEFEEISIDFPANTNGTRISFGDYNNDNYEDFFITGVNNNKEKVVFENHVFKNDKTGHFNKLAVQFYPLSDVWPHWQDFDSDGDLDILISGYDSENDAKKNIFYQNNGNDSFIEVNNNYPNYSYASSSFADIDNNGYIDILVSTRLENEGNTKTYLFFNQGNWNFTESNDLGILENDWFNIQFADIDNDTFLDIGGTTINSSVSTEIYHNNSSFDANNQPVAPVTIGAEQDEDELMLSWNPSSDEETNTTALTYNLYVKSGNYWQISPNSNTETGYRTINERGNMDFRTHITLNTSDWNEGHYFWGVQAIDQSYLASAFSSWKEFTIYHNNLTDAPSNLLLEQNNLDQVHLTWTDNSDNEQNQIVERKDGISGVFNPIENIGANVSYYNDNSILPKSQYFYRIKMENANGESGYSDIKYIKTLTADISVPILVNVQQESSSELSMTWEDNSNNENGFFIERSMGNQSDFIRIDTVDTSITQYWDKGLESETNYFYRIAAYNDEGESYFSNIKNNTTLIYSFVNLETILYEIYPSSGMSWGDFDNDGLEDLFLSKYPPVLYKNNGNQNFSIVNNTGIDFDGTSYNEIFGIWGDYDNDGFLDLFIAHRDSKNSLFHNNGDATFTRIQTGDLVNENKKTYSANWHDYDGDGDLDIVISDYGNNELFRYDGDDVFTLIDIDFSGTSYGSSWGDYNHDGLPDLLIGNREENELYQYKGNEEFEKILSSSLVNEDDDSWTVSWADYNNDDYEDVLVTSYSKEKQWVYKNNKDNTFTKLPNLIPYLSHIKTGLWFDYDNDMDLDVFLFSSDYKLHSHKLLTNKGDDEFKYSPVGFPEEISSSYVSYGSCYDFNDDGFNDILMCSYTNQLFLNGGNGNNWIKIQLKGSPSNSFGNGATIKIKANNVWQTHTLKTQSAFHTQNGNIINMGLKTANIVDSIVVQWPMGTVQYLTNISVNQKITIEEQNAETKPLYKPSNLLAKSLSNGLTLEWQDNSFNEDGFVLEKDINNSGNYQPIAQLDANVVEYIDAEIEAYREYSYRLKAIKGDKSTDWTNVCHYYSSFFTEHKGFSDHNDDDKTTCIAWVDFDNDDDTDIFVGNSDNIDKLYRNNNNTSFSLVENTSISNENTSTSFGAWADFNNDGNIDVFKTINDHSDSQKNILFSGNGNGHFDEFLSGDIVNGENKSNVAAWGDYNKDGFIDIFIGNTYHNSLLYKNNGNGSFTKITNQPMHNSSVLDAVWSDFDRDNDLDLFIVNADRSLRLYRNYGSGDFEHIYMNELGVSTPFDVSGVNIEDFNNDGQFDLHITGNSRNRIYLNNNGQFVENTNSPFGESNSITHTSVCADINNDGYMDIFVANSDSNIIYINNGNATFQGYKGESFSYQNFQTYSAAFGDADGDGDLDLCLGNYREPNKCYNNQSNSQNWIAFKLKTEIGKNIIGTKISIHTNRGIQIREIRSNTGRGSQNSYVGYFGLGSQTDVNFVRVISPLGEKSFYNKPIVGSINEIDADELGVSFISKKEYSIYPNPMSDYLNIDLNGNEYLQAIKIISLSGKTLMEFLLENKTSHSLKLNNIPSGMYIIELRFKDGINYERVIISK